MIEKLIKELDNDGRFYYVSNLYDAKYVSEITANKNYIDKFEQEDEREVMAYYNTPLKINYNEKDIAKQYGAKWDKDKKQWYMFHFDNWTNYETLNYYTDISQDAFESLSNVNNIAKKLNRDIFDIIPSYKEYEKSLSNILTRYACQYSGIENCSDVLYHPETYFNDLRVQYEKYKEMSNTFEGTNAGNTEFIRKQCAVVCNNYKNLLETCNKFPTEIVAQENEEDYEIIL